MKLDDGTRIADLPDLKFVKYCNETYGVNRGVYNTIDEWFYKNNIVDVKIRREMILQFLLFSITVVNNGGEKETLKFGKGNLVDLLSKFVKEQTVKKRVEETSVHSVA